MCLNNNLHLSADTLLPPPPLLLNKKLSKPLHLFLSLSLSYFKLKIRYSRITGTMKSIPQIFLTWALATIIFSLKLMDIEFAKFSGKTEQNTW